MTSFSPSPVTKKNRLQNVKRLPPKLAIGGGVCLLIGILWFVILQPLQHTLEQRLQRYPSQLMSIQELNRTLLTYKDKNIKVASVSENELSALQQKLFSQGVKFTLVRLENMGAAQLELKIDEIEFSRWLELMVDFRQNYALYASDVVLKKNEGVGVVQVSATLVQAR
jgi:type II secretory pathway component PulM